MRFMLTQIFASFAAMTMISCSAKDREWDNPNDPFVIERNKVGAAPSATPNANPAADLLEPLSFKRFDLPSAADAFDINSDAGSTRVVKSAFEQTITLLRIERSKNLSDYYWRLNARKYSLSPAGLIPVTGLSAPVNIFPECNDPVQGKGVSKFEITEISDKFRVPGFSADALPDNVTHIKLSVTCQSATLGTTPVTKSKIISLATLEEDVTVSLTPLASQKGIKCAWPSKKILVGTDGQLFNYQYWRGTKIPGNFSNSGSLNLGEISSCYEVAGQLEIKTTERCYSFDLTSNTLLSSACATISRSFGAFAFDNFHEPFRKVNDCNVEGTFYDFLAGDDRHVVTGKAVYRTSGYSSIYEWDFQYTKNGVKQANVDAAQWSMLLSHSQGDGCGFWKPSASAKMGNESPFGQRILGWSEDRTAIFLSSKIISDATIEERRYSSDPLDAELARVVTFTNAAAINSTGQRVLYSSDISLSLSSKFLLNQEVKLKVYTNDSDDKSSWYPWSENLSISFPASDIPEPIRLRFRDKAGFVSDELILAYVDTSPPMVLGIERANSESTAVVGSEVNFLVRFSEPIKGLSPSNFSVSESLHGDATGTVTAVLCGSDASRCDVKVKAIRSGHLRLDLSSVTGVTDFADRTIATTRTGDESYTISGWYPEAYVKAANANSDDQFGYSVSLSGDFLAVGSPGEDSGQTTITNGTEASSDNTRNNSGAVYVYRRSGSVWVQDAYLKNSNVSFGESVSISGDTLVESGTKVFRRSSIGWAIESAFWGCGSFSIGHLVGNTVACGASSDGSGQTTITNVPPSYDNSAPWSGSAAVYRRSGSAWAQEAFVKAVNAQAHDHFGESASISGDTLAVGAPQEDSYQTTITNGTWASGDNSRSDSGAVYVYRRSTAGWAQDAYIKAANAGSSDYFGFSISLSGDTLAAGAKYESSSQITITNGSGASNNDAASQAGAVYVYRRTGSTWAQEAYVKASNANSGDFFGHTIALSGDTLAVGAYGEDSNQKTVTNGSGASSSGFEYGAGAVYVYRRSGSTWAQEAYVKAGNAGMNDRFGHSVSLSGDTLVVGAYFEDSYQSTITNGVLASSDNSAADAGAVYVYRNLGRLFDPDVRISAQTSNSITLSWHANLGTTATVKIAPASSGTASPNACTDASAVTLTAGATSYTYSGLDANSKYGFRVCAFDGTNVSQGALIWENTLP